MSDNETKETQVAEETQNTVATESNNEDRKGRRGQRGEGRRGERRNRREENHGDELLDRVVTINRVSNSIFYIDFLKSSANKLFFMQETTATPSLGIPKQ